ncbi:hypothetical protein C2G38_2319518 [Gigaspora rosea]|uniref:Uncharacterized protein n=1 Tax=Gigaspora rosea TaxID=44941 RepID=A0A397V205_9GLOM|nr:hypothetical protein C2G38_2319518 [Gigaspora rosea]
MEWGAVIDWDGKARSLVPFPGFWMNSTIQPNANNKFGFLRFDFEVFYAVDGSFILGTLRQYSSDDSGNLTVMCEVPSYDIPVTIVSTLNNGYLAFYYNDTMNKNDNNSYDNNSLLPRGGLYVQIISYNDSRSGIQGTYAYQISQPNMKINSVYCDTSVLYTYSIYCIVSVNSNNTARYISIPLSQSGFPLHLPNESEIYDLPNVDGLSHQGWRAKTMASAAYILGLTAYDDNDHSTYHYIYAYDDFVNTQIPLTTPSPFLTNYFGANVIMDNNTFLLASQYTTNNASWSLLMIQLPDVSLYSFDIDIDSPLKGIHDGIWILKTDEVVMGSVRLTEDASKTFLTRSENNKLIIY